MVDLDALKLRLSLSRPLLSGFLASGEIPELRWEPLMGKDCLIWGRSLTFSEPGGIQERIYENPLNKGSSFEHS